MIQLQRRPHWPKFRRNPPLLTIRARPDWIGQTNIPVIFAHGTARSVA